MIYDTVDAYDLEIGDNAIIDGEYVEIRELVSTDLFIKIHGYCHNTGDMEDYTIPVEASINLWTGEIE